MGEDEVFDDLYDDSYEEYGEFETDRVFTGPLAEMLRDLGFERRYLSDGSGSWYARDFSFSGGKFEITVDENITINPASPNSMVDLVVMETNMENFLYIAKKWELYE
jgi:hypothetical protein